MLSTPTLSLSTLSDEALIHQFKQTEDRQFIGELYLRYRHLVYGACLKYLEDRTESQDVVMAIFEKIIQKLPHCEVINFSPWLYSVIKSECLMRLRSRKVQNKLKDNIQQFEADQATFTPDYDQQITQQTPATDREELVIEAIKKLKKEQQVCIKLFFFEEKRYREIETITGYSAKAVKSHLQNGKRLIRQYIEMEDH